MAAKDSKIVLKWVVIFMKETTALCRSFKYLLLTLDGFVAHLSYESLYRLKESKLLTVALPAHTSHPTQILGFTALAPFNQKVRCEWNSILLP